MKTPIRIVLCALILAASLRPTHADDNSNPAPARLTGHVLIMLNENSIEGEIEFTGGQYRVRRPVGALYVYPEEVLKLCENREEAYLFLKQRANLRDPDERLRLAKWCRQNALKQQELDEVTAAVNLRPENRDAVALLRNLRRMMAMAAESKAPTKASLETESATIPASVNTDSLGLFVTKVQPILMNRCATCHGSDRGGAFKLARVFDAGPNRHVTLKNLAAVVAQIKNDRPLTSPLLVKSISVHGDMAQPALKGTESPAYRTLEEWVRITIDAGPIGPKDAAGTISSSRADSLTPKGISENTPQTSGASTAFGEGREVGKPAGPGNPKTPVVDPYDPELFNRQLHPQGKPPGPNQ